MMKKVIFSLLLIVLIMPLNVKAKTYFVKSIENNNEVIDLGTYEDYSKALEAMNNPELKNGAVIYNSNNEIINASYAIGDIGGHGIIYVYQNKDDYEKGRIYYTYIESNWGSDVAFIDYYESNTPMVKVKISGVTGWIKKSNINIIPVSLSNYIRVIEPSGLYVRETPSRNANSIDNGVGYNSTHIYYDTCENEGYIWYKIMLNGKYGWIAGKNSTETYATPFSYNLNTYYKVTPRNINGKNYNSMTHIYRMSRSNSLVTLYLGEAPSYLKQNVTYYSFDGNYFYESILDMLSDYKNETYNKAVNKETPYYDYYMYLPSHSLTGYTADDLNNIIISYNYTSAPDPNIVYVDNNGNFINGVNRNGVSALYNQGENFIKFQNNYGINAFLAFSTALNESGRGTNIFSIGKNNVLSIGVCDSCTYINTTKYNTVYDNLVAYASMVNSNYSNPSNGIYYGSHYGNKGSGMNVNYASDPYWGEKQAQYSYQKDREFGGHDYNSNIIGIKQKKESVKIYKTPYTTSNVIYELKNAKYNHLIENMSLIVIGKIVTYENDIETTWYKVYTEPSLDENQNVITGSYTFNNSYGYVKASDFYISNASDVIELNEEGYIETDGLFHLENLTFENNLLDFKGFLIVYGTNNLKTFNSKYKMIFVNQETNERFEKNLDMLKEPPFAAPNMDGYDYSGSWFNSKLDLSDIKEGDYTTYVSAFVNGYQTTALLTNKLFNRNVTSKYVDENGRGYQFKSNYYDNTMPLELFIRDEGLISNEVTPTTDNMFNQYYSIDLKDGYLDIMGTSHNVGGNYASNRNISRKLVLSNVKTLKNDIIVDTELVKDKPYLVSLRVSDNFDKTNAWYQAHIDISSLDKGTYAIYVHTIVEEVDDYGEVNDILYTDINASMTYNDKTYKIIRNKNKRYRLELVIE